MQESRALLEDGQNKVEINSSHTEVVSRLISELEAGPASKCCCCFERLGQWHEREGHIYSCLCFPCNNCCCSTLNWIAELFDGLSLSSRFWYSTCGYKSSYPGRSIWGVLFPLWLLIMLALVLIELVVAVIVLTVLLVLGLILLVIAMVIVPFICLFFLLKCIRRRIRGW